jgi:hypothetical protein
VPVSKTRDPREEVLVINHAGAGGVGGLERPANVAHSPGEVLTEVVKPEGLGAEVGDVGEEPADIREAL